MFLLLERTQNNAIVCISEQINIEEDDRNIYVPMENTYYALDTLDIVEIETVPADIMVGRHCYSEVRGFFENPNYRVPSEETLEKIESRFETLETENTQLKAENLNLKIAIAEIYEEVNN